MTEEPTLHASDFIFEKPQIAFRELALFFLRLCMAAFGGPAAHAAMMEDELVHRRKWLSREKFLAAASLIAPLRFRLNSAGLVLIAAVIRPMARAIL